MKKRVLLVDENREELFSFLEILKHIPVTLKCTHADNGMRAIEVLQHTVPDLIFIDYGLSQTDALQLVSAIRFQSKLRETRVYLYSETISDEDSKMARMLGATGCIEKSGEFSNLVHKFKAIFSPELLPSYVFLKNYQDQFVCFNAAFLMTENDEAGERNSSLTAGSLSMPSNGSFQNERRSVSM